MKNLTWGIFMYFKILYTVILALLIGGCGGEPEPDEFTKLRMDMQKRHSQYYGDSVEKLESRKHSINLNNKGIVNQIDPEEESRIQQEAEKKRWLAVDIDEEEAEDWKAMGLSPKNASRWKKTGLSYNTISVLIKEDVLASEAVAFMNKSFSKYPRAFIQFAQPLYEFKHSCNSILQANRPNFQIINKQCHEYIQLLEFSKISGYLADEYNDNDLSLEYISKLRQIDAQKSYIQKEMVKKSYLSMINGDMKGFSLLFPILETSPSKEEMYFVKQHKLKLADTKRYKSNKYYEFWENKDKAEEQARLVAIQQQRSLKLAKEARLREQAHRMQALAHNKMVASECGELVTSAPSTGEKVHIEGKVLYTIGKRSSNIFAYVVKNDKDAKSYLVRDASTNKSETVGNKVSWSALTVGRVASVSLDDDGTASYNHYANDDKEFYPMLKYISKCAHHTKDIE